MSWVIGRMKNLCRLEGSGRTASRPSASSPTSRRAAVIPRDDARPPAVRRPAAWFGCDIIKIWWVRSSSDALLVPPGSITAAGCCCADDSTRLLLICASSNRPLQAPIGCGDRSFRGVVVRRHCGQRTLECYSSNATTGGRGMVSPFGGVRTRPVWQRRERILSVRRSERAFASGLRKGARPNIPICWLN